MGIIITAVIIAALYLIVKTVIKNAKENDTENNHSTPCVDTPTVNIPQNKERLEKPSYEYSYYELVGMKFCKLTHNDIGVFDGYAFAEDNNEYDKYAVGIYRTDNNKLVAHVPKEFRGKSNKDLHEAIAKIGGSTHARFQIKEGSTGTLYGSAYIKD